MSGTWCSEVSTVTSGLSLLGPDPSPSSLACQKIYRNRNLRKGLGLTVLSLVRNRGMRNPDAVSHTDGKDLS